MPRKRNQEPTQQQSPAKDTTTKPKRTGRPYKNKQVDGSPNSIDLNKALTLRFHNRLSYGDIAQHMGVSKAAVHKAITKFMDHIDDPDAIAAFKSSRADLLTAAQLTVLRSVVDPAKLEKASTNNAAYALRQLFDMERLERGESTANVAYHNIEGKISELDAKERELRRSLGESIDADFESVEGQE